MRSSGTGGGAMQSGPASQAASSLNQLLFNLFVIGIVVSILSLAVVSLSRACISALDLFRTGHIEMSEEIKNVLIAGVSEWIFLYESYMKLSNRSKASGNLGPFVLDALNQYPQFTVSVLSRKGSKSTFPSHITVHHVAESYDEEELLPTLKGQDAVISLIRPGQQKEIKSLIDACVKAGVKRFIPGEFGSNSVPEAVREAVPWLQNKLNLVNHLKTKESDGLTWTSVVCGAFFDW